MIDGSLTISTPDRALDADELRADVFGLRSQVGPGGAAKLVGLDAAGVAAALCALQGWAGEIHLVGPGVDADAVAAPAIELGGAETDLTSVGTPDVDTRWILYTSGTTGEPKPIAHTLKSLTRTVNPNPSSPLNWGLLYDPNRMAGIQVVLQALLTGSNLVAPSIESPLPERLRVLADGGVTALSATPSLWRQVLQMPASRGLSLRQITLGGEIADQKILDALAHAFPEANITHVFASTETAAAFSVKDGREGFPVAYLEDPPRGIALQVRDDILHVHSPGTSAAGEDGFASTGDIVEIVGDRVLFRGRSSGVVNVGGTNVWPEVVEAILREHDDVLEAVVTAKPNALVGNMLVAKVTLVASADADTAPKRLRSWVRGQAPKPYVPATVEVVDELTLAATGKITR